jgi:endonuclease/exonuclease/phosphatase family metal-dependent hydrolase
MRRLILAFGFLLLAFSCVGERIRISTWNLQWFPSGTPNNAPTEVEERRINEAAGTLRSLSPDIILLQEVRDGPTCERLIEALKPEVYFLAVCSAFKDDVGAAIGRQQVAILSKRQASAAWAEKWKTTSFVDPPRGFSFAAFRFGTNDVGVYSVHLKSNLTRGDAERENQLNMLKRELSAEQLIRHSKEVTQVLTNDLEMIVIGGDFNTNLENPLFVSENTLRLLKKEGFRSGFENVPASNRVTCPGKGRYPDATFDWIFVRGGDSVSNPKITSFQVSDHFPVTREVDVPDRN